MKSKLTNFLLFVLVVTSFFAINSIDSIKTVSQPQTQFGDSGFPNLFYAVSTTTFYNLGTSNITVLATSTGGRTYATISNNGSTSIFCTFNGLPAVNNQGFAIPASTTKQIDSTALYQGPVNCISQIGTVPVYVQAIQ